MNFRMLRLASCAVPVKVADTDANQTHIIDAMHRCHKASVAVAVFPELCITGYTCGDLFHNSTLINATVDALRVIVEASAELKGMVTFVGAPLRGTDDALYNCAVAVAEGRVLAVVPKSYLPGYNEFYEKRWFARAPISVVKARLWDGAPEMELRQQALVFGNVTVGVEICEDLWSPLPPSCALALSGCSVIANLSASDDLIGKHSYLKQLVSQQSARCICAYAYSSAGFGESSTDVVFDSKLIISENGRIIRSNKQWQSGTQIVVADVDLEALEHDRLHNTTFADCIRRNDTMLVGRTETGISLQVPDFDTTALERTIEPMPFVPAKDDKLHDRCEEIIAIQVAALAQRLDAIRCKSLTVGISGGLDSTLALLVATRAFDRLGLDRKGIIGVTMPGFGTTGRTYNNALTLMRTLGVTIREIPIADAVNLHFRDINHDPEVHDVTYENAQARERTQILMDVANQTGGIVLGTGDLSELALGWATYNGDHMSMYGVNAGVPKTLVRHLVAHFAAVTANPEERRALLDIIDTPVSPELLPAQADGTIAQKTEDLVGPYELHDFFLYHTLRNGFGPAKIFFMARHAFGDRYPADEILKWERTFFRRFFAQQFKRSALPDGPKVGSVCLSPRGDWRMPSDASAAMWLKELDQINVCDN